MFLLIASTCFPYDANAALEGGVTIVQYRDKVGDMYLCSLMTELMFLQQTVANIVQDELGMSLLVRCLLPTGLGQI